MAVRHPGPTLGPPWAHPTPNPDAYEDEDGIDTEKRDAALTARYVDEEEAKDEQEQWEEEQVRMDG